MIKEINFPEMMEKNRKFREETDQKMNDLILKMKKKVGSNQLLAFEQTMIEKLDKFLSDNEKSKAEKEETKQALIFLEKRVTLHLFRSVIQNKFLLKKRMNRKRTHYSALKNGIAHHVLKIWANMRENLDSISPGQPSHAKSSILRKQEGSVI